MTLDVSRETQQRFEAYESLIRQWNPRINLVAPTTLAEFQSRHVADSLQIAGHVTPQAGVWADLGSGGGLPGLILAIYHENTPTQFILLESDQRKAAFLRTVCRKLSLSNVTVRATRIEDAEPLNAAYISARALAPLPKLISYLARHLGHDGQAWVMKGAKWQSELASARDAWQFDAESFPSRTQPDAAILRISGITNV